MCSCPYFKHSQILIWNVVYYFLSVLIFKMMINSYQQKNIKYLQYFKFKHKYINLRKMSSSAQRRLLKDLQKIKKQQDEGINASPLENNLLKWQAIIEGSEGTAWEGGLFQLQIDFTEQYPNKAPNVVFKSQMFHPNIYKDGRICLDILQNQWSPVYDVWAILTSLRSLLSDPNPLSPANSVAAQMYNENKSQYERRVREIVQKSLN